MSKRQIFLSISYLSVILAMIAVGLIFYYQLVGVEFFLSSMVPLSLLCSAFVIRKNAKNLNTQ